MRRLARPAGVVALGATLALAGCATAGLVDGVYHSPKGYRIAAPGPDWVAGEGGPADVVLRQRGGDGRLLAHATCDAATVGRPPEILGLHLLAGARERVVLERDEVRLEAGPAAHTVLEVPGGPADGPIRIETYTVKSARCVFDLVYAAPRPGFERGRAAFDRFVASFATE